MLISQFEALRSAVDAIVRTDTLTQNDMLKALHLGADDILSENGNFGGDFWHNEVLVNLDLLQEGNLNAFTILKNVHDATCMSFAEEQGIEQTAVIPDGALGSAIADLCLDIWNRRLELTCGYCTEWKGDWKAVWTEDENNNSVEEARSYWEDDFKVRVGDMSRVEAYDLAEEFNNERCYENIMKAKIATLEKVTAGTIQNVLEEVYPSDASSMIYLNYREAAEAMLDKWDRDQEEK